MAYAADMIRGLVAGLLVLVTLVAFAGPGFAKAVAPATTARPLPAAPDSAAGVRGPVATVVQVLSADHGVARPCHGHGALPSARCSTAVPCAAGGLPPGAFAVPAPAAGSGAPPPTGDDLARGITRLPDLPPPRLSA